MKRLMFAAVTLLMSGSAAYAAAPETVIKAATSCCEALAACCGLALSCCP